MQEQPDVFVGDPSTPDRIKRRVFLLLRQVIRLRAEKEALEAEVRTLREWMKARGVT
jgi:hypothetical protein